MYVSVRHSFILPLKTDRDHTSLESSGIGVKIKVFPSTSNLLFLNLTALRYNFLFLNSETYIVHVINCERSRSVNFPLCMFCMQYKHVFFQ